MHSSTPTKQKDHGIRYDQEQEDSLLSMFKAEVVNSCSAVAAAVASYTNTTGTVAVTVPVNDPLFHIDHVCKSYSLKEILDMQDASEEFIFDEDDERLSSTHARASATAAAAIPEEGILEDFPVDPNVVAKNNIPVAADLVNSRHLASLFTLTAVSSTAPSRKRASYFEDDDQGDSYSSLSSAQNKITVAAFLAKSDSSQEGSELETTTKRQRPFQAGQWSERFTELLNFKRIHGHCLVPYTHKTNLPLARWVKRQRYQHKLFLQESQGNSYTNMNDDSIKNDSGDQIIKTSTMTQERIQALQEIGFIWDSQAAQWSERLQELAEFRSKFGHCNVPSSYKGNAPLATWVKCQRRQYKLFVMGKNSNTNENTTKTTFSNTNVDDISNNHQEAPSTHITEERIQLLQDLGFQWQLRRTTPYLKKARRS